MTKPFLPIPWIVALSAVLFALSNAVTAVAQEKKRSEVIRLEAMVIEGNIQKPNAFFVNTRSALVYDRLPLKESFVSEITKVVEDGTF
ncbi:MAG: hypothetical protein QNJ97_20500 [Myxococcota bacterium]|nr:hypothetical protein [Myxococcota bacterium]